MVTISLFVMAIASSLSTKSGNVLRYLFGARHGHVVCRHQRIGFQGPDQVLTEIKIGSYLYGE